MRICIVGKFPPLQGGTAVQTFWLAYRLAHAGCEVVVISASAASPPGELCFHRPDEWSVLARRFPAAAQIRRVEIDAEGPDAAAIPSTDAYVSRLAAAALEAIDADGCEAVIGSYLEPYGVAAHLAATARELPFAFIHAGSDLGRLAHLPSRRGVYSHVLRTADLIVGTRSSAAELTALRGSDDGLIETRPILTPRALFASAVEPLNLVELHDALRGTPHGELRSGTPETPGPVIGIYGKPGPEKGTDALLAAVGAVRQSGTPVSLLMMTGGRQGAYRWLHDRIRAHALTDNVTVIPFLPHWRVPEFIARCDCVCFLEHDFPIAAHRPQVPREIAAAGGCLIVSVQALAAEPVSVVDGEHALVVDPTDRGQLAQALGRAIHDPELRAALSARVAGAYGWSSEIRATRWIDILIAMLDERANQKRGLSMSLAAYQRTLLRIYADPVYRRELMADPPRVGEEEDLTPAEAASLASLLGDRVGLQRYCASLLDDRLRRLCAPFSDLLEAYAELGPVLRSAFHDRWVLRDTDPVTELGDFEHMLVSVGEDALEPAALRWFSEWVRYAALCARVVARDGPPARPQRWPDGDDMLVTRASGSELATFAGRLVQSRWEPGETPWQVAAVCDPDHRQARVYELAPPVWSELSRFHGVLALGAFASRLAGSDAEPAVRDAADAAARRLLDLGLLAPAR